MSSGFDYEVPALLQRALQILDQGFDHMPEYQRDYDVTQVSKIIDDTARRLRDNYPYQHPLYVGQMLKPPHPIAHVAYTLAMFLNPNNHALDGGRASSVMEIEAVAQIARMFGFKSHLGHLCGGGTMANFEALWVAGRLHPGQAIAASDQAHYTHARLSSVLNLPYVQIASDARGCMDVGSLQQALGEHDIGTVVVTVGTTAAGTVDPLPQILKLKQRYGFRLHVDTAYGGYFALLDDLDQAEAAAFAAISQADSVVVDPHKHGLQPYGCGCVLFADPDVGRFYQHDSPYTYFSSTDLHLGEISLECSRAGASAVALWATMQLLPLESGGQFAQSLAQCRRAALELYAALERDSRFVPLFYPQLDIVVWAVVADTSSRSSAMAKAVFDAAAKLGLHLAVASFPRHLCEPAEPVTEWNSEKLVCLRACAMKPEHDAWMSEIIERLGQAAQVLKSV